MPQKTSSPGRVSGEGRDPRKPATPAAADVHDSTEHEPAQGHIQTGTRYRDRPTDDGKYGDGDQEPIRKD
jgi:hypothetical protein